MREGAGLQDAGVMRAVLETATTALYLAAFVSWMGEDTAGSPRTRRLLEGLLPDVHAKGTGYTHESVPELATNRRLGIRVAITGDPKQNATREIIRKIQIRK